jgi:hypothetical protein
MSTQETTALISRYLAAFSAASSDSHIPLLSYERGWFVFRTRRANGLTYVNARYRRTTLIEMTKTLEARANA